MQRAIEKTQAKTLFVKPFWALLFGLSLGSLPGLHLASAQTPPEVESATGSPDSRQSDTEKEQPENASKNISIDESEVDPKRDCENIAEQNKIKPNQRLDRKLLRTFKDKKIGEISIRVNNIFDESDPDEDRALYRFANRIQVNTRERVIRSQLLFEEGGPISLSDLRESLRILYNREYLLDAKLIATRVCGDAVDLEVTVRDAWVIYPEIKLGRQGGENSSGIALRDGNFLGSGNEISLGYEKDADRTMVTYRFRTKNFLRRRLEVDVYHADLSDGTNSRLSLVKPFYSVNTRFAYGFETGRTSLRYKTRFEDEIINEFNQITDLDSAFAGMAVSRERERTYRIKIGYTDQQEEFRAVEDTVRLPERDSEKYPWVELERVTNIFEQYSNLSYIARSEDIEVGSNYRIRFGAGESEGGQDIYRLISDYSTVLSISDDHLFRFKLSADVIKDKNDDSFQDSIAGFEAIYNYFISGKNRWHFMLDYDEGKDLSEYRQLTVGEVDGVRGYPLAYQRGDRRYVVNVERRFYSDLHLLNLVRAGAVIFADFGRAWGAEDFPNTNHLRSVGFGLRFHSSKTGSPAVVHLNIGAPLSDNDTLDDYLFSATVETVF